MNFSFHAQPPSERESKMAYLICTEGGSDKFYEISASGCDVTMRYGKTGTAGVSSTKTFATENEAAKFVTKTVNEKTKKGYVLSEGGAGKKRSGGGLNAAAAPAGKKSKPVQVEPEEEEDDDDEDEDEEDGEDGDEEEDGMDNTIFMTCTEGDTEKFYQMTLMGKDVSISQGVVGTDGVTSVKSFSTEVKAQGFMEQMLGEKTSKGYEVQDFEGEGEMVTTEAS